MQEIAPHVFIETGYPGVTLGAIAWPHGLILVDAPFRADDVRLWRTTLLNMSGGVDRILVNLDAHFDRTLGTRLMECTVAGHEKMVQVFRDRPVTFKAQTVETGAEWELYNSLGAVRWAPPEITFSDSINLFWDGAPVLLEYHPGPSPEAIWLKLPNEKIVFVGDTVVPNAPPFLFCAVISEWLAAIDLLLSPEYSGYIVVSGRGGLVTVNDIQRQAGFLQEVDDIIQRACDDKLPADELDHFIPDLLNQFEIPAGKREHYWMRLKYGLLHYYNTHSKLRSSAQCE